MPLDSEENFLRMCKTKNHVKRFDNFQDILLDTLGGTKCAEKTQLVNGVE